jgi:hypothetical protein
LLPETYEFDAGLGPDKFFGLFNWHFKWENIKYQEAAFDINDVKFDLTTKPTSAIKIDFPALKFWKIEADQTTDTWWLPDAHHVTMTFKNFDVDFHAELHVDDHGSLAPKIAGVNIDFGQSEFHHDNWFVDIFVWPVYKFFIQTIQVLGGAIEDWFFSDMLSPLLDAYMNGYQIPMTIKSPLPGQNT